MLGYDRLAVSGQLAQRQIVAPIQRTLRTPSVDFEAHLVGLARESSWLWPAPVAVLSLPLLARQRCRPEPNLGRFVLAR